jgi:hypothetical protein
MLIVLLGDAEVEDAIDNPGVHLLAEALSGAAYAECEATRGFVRGWLKLTNLAFLHI